MLHPEGDPIGIAYLSCKTDREWAFANYFGIHEDWRNRWDIPFVVFLKKSLQRLVPNAKGIVFEIESIDKELLKRAGCQEKVKGEPDQDEIVTHARRWRRLTYYQKMQARTALQEDGTWFPYAQPAMDDESCKKHECPMILMVAPLDIDTGLPADLSPNDVADFVYDELFRDAYGEPGESYRPKFRKYLQELKKRMRSRTKGMPKFDVVSTPPEIRMLLKTLKRENLL